MFFGKGLRSVAGRGELDYLLSGFRLRLLARFYLPPSGVLQEVTSARRGSTRCQINLSLYWISRTSRCIGLWLIILDLNHGDDQVEAWPTLTEIYRRQSYNGKEKTTSRYSISIRDTIWARVLPGPLRVVDMAAYFESL